MTSTPTPKPKLETADQRISYGIALNVGANITRQGGVEIDTTAFLAGLLDGLRGSEPKLSEAEIKAAFASAQGKQEKTSKTDSTKQARAGIFSYLKTSHVRAWWKPIPGSNTKCWLKAKGPSQSLIKPSRCITTAP